jgi:hypothetical protein
MLIISLRDVLGRQKSLEAQRIGGMRSVFFRRSLRYPTRLILNIVSSNGASVTYEAAV